MKTYSAKPKEIEKKWYLLDAKGQILGRLATRVAWILMGKNKSIYSPNLDCGDFIIVINAEKIKVTGNKLEDKIYYHHTGYIGGMKTDTLGDKLKSKPEDVIYHAVRLMLPKTKLGRAMLKKLFVYKDESHPHKAQKPEVLEFKKIRKIKE